MIKTHISRNDKFLNFDDSIIYDFLSLKLDQACILVNYLVIDFKPSVVEDYLKQLSDLFKSFKDNKDSICFAALRDKSFDAEKYIVGDEPFLKEG